MEQVYMLGTAKPLITSLLSRERTLMELSWEIWLKSRQPSIWQCSQL